MNNDFFLLKLVGANVIGGVLWIAVGYLIVTLTISAVFNLLERKLGVAR